MSNFKFHMFSYRFSIIQSLLFNSTIWHFKLILIGDNLVKMINEQNMSFYESQIPLFYPQIRLHNFILEKRVK